MSNLLVQNNNFFSKFWIWLKKIFYKESKNNKNSNEISILKNEKNNSEIIFKESIKQSSLKKQETLIDQEVLKQENSQIEKHLYVKDLDYETEKKYTVNLLMDVLNHKKQLKDLDLADVVRINILYNN